MGQQIKPQEYPPLADLRAGNLSASCLALKRYGMNPEQFRRLFSVESVHLSSLVSVVLHHAEWMRQGFRGL